MKGSALFQGEIITKFRKYIDKFGRSEKRIELIYISIGIKMNSFTKFDEILSCFGEVTKHKNRVHFL